MKYISLFAGADIGNSLLKNLGLELALAYELLPKRRGIIKLNNPNAIICNNILDKELPDIKDDIFLMTISPPCQEFSTQVATKSYSQMNQLIKAAKPMIERYNPVWIVIENVPTFKTRTIPDTEDIVMDNPIDFTCIRDQKITDLAKLGILTQKEADLIISQDIHERKNPEKAKANQRLRSIRRLPEIELRKLNKEYKDKNRITPYNWLIKYIPNYKICNFMLDAADFGVAQYRKRMFIVMNRISKDFTPPEPTVSKHLSLFEAIGYLPSLVSGQRDLNDPFHFAPFLTEYKIKILENTPEGQSAFDNQDEWKPKTLNKDGTWRACQGHKSSYYRSNRNAPAGTIKQRSDNVGSDYTIHYKDNRPFSVRECIILQGISEHFKWSTLSQQQIRKCIGESISPVVMLAIVKKILDINEEQNADNFK